MLINAGQLLPDKQSTTGIHHQILVFNIIVFIVLESDEAGSGDYFGPLTVCAAYVTNHISKS